MSAPAPLWRQAYDAAERVLAPRIEELVRTPGFSVGVALVRRAQSVASASASDLSARAWHLVNLPAGTDVHRLRTQVGALDREVRRLTVQLEAERRRDRTDRTATVEESHADRAQPADRPRARAEGRRTERTARP